jgi:hypothetical protein
MTNPQDPNQTGQPGGPAPQGWGQQTDSNQPPVVAPAPNTVPDWAAQAPQQPPSQPVWSAPPPKKKGGHGCLIAFIIVLFIFLLGVGGCTVLVAIVAVNVAPAASVAIEDEKIQADLGVKGIVAPDTSGGHRTWVVTLQPGYEAQAKQIACGIVKADLNGTQFSGDSIQVEDSSGNVLSDGSGC